MADDKQKFAPQIARLVPINELPAAVQNEVINRCNLIKVRKGGFIFKQGDRDEFAYYLLDGEIELIANNQLHNTIAAGTDRARYAMAQLQPRQFGARASKTAVVMQVVRDYLDKMMVVHQKEDGGEDVTNYDLATAEVEVEELHAADDVDWMTKMLQSELFSKMPTANIQSLFALLEPVEFQKGDIVIRQGEPGQHYFIIQEGRCQVLRAPPSGGKEIKLADLGPGDSFGEEALITDTPRNATVAMTTPGILMRLEKDKFIELIKKPTLRGVNFDQAVKLVIEGAQWLDVRFKNEYDQGAIRDSIHIPLNVLRMQTEKLNPSKSYVVYCDTGGRSSAGAFLLAERGFKVWYLQGGLQNNPKAAEMIQAVEGEGRMVEPPPPAAARAPAAPRPAPPSPKPAAPVAAAKPRAPEPVPAAKAPPAPARPEAAAVEEDVDPEKLDPAIKASVLETELARTDHRLEALEKQRKEFMDKAQKDVQAEITRRLQEERAKIEVAKRQAEEEARRLRAAEEEKIRRMKEDAEQRLQAEKQKLEEVYSRNVEEMEKLQRLKQEAEEHVRRERERLEQESAQARKQLEDAQRIKKQIEAAKKAMEQEAERRRLEQEQMERDIQKKAREKLETERRKLAEQFARNNQELEEARNERAAADAARNAAREEAERIIAEYKAKHEAARAEEEARMRAERQKLEDQQRKIQEMLSHADSVQRDAEAAKSAAAAEVDRLRSRQQDDEVTQSRVARESLNAELRDAEERLGRARREIADAERERVRAEEARRINEEDLVKRYEIEEETRKQLEQDLEQFKEQLAQEEKKFASLSSQMEHMRRIKKRADEAKLATQQHTDNLLSDVASQLRQGN